MASLRSKYTTRATLLALLCLAVVLVAAFAGPFHKHDSSPDPNCLLCHVSERANVVAIASDAGKPFVALAHDLTLSPVREVVVEVPDLARTPRAPPSSLLSL